MWDKKSGLPLFTKFWQLSIHSGFLIFPFHNRLWHLQNENNIPIHEVEINAGCKKFHHKTINHIFNKSLDRNWFSTRHL